MGESNKKQEYEKISRLSQRFFAVMGVFVSFYGVIPNFFEFNDIELQKLHNMSISTSNAPQTPQNSLLSHTSALLDGVADEVREALHMYDANNTEGMDTPEMKGPPLDMHGQDTNGIVSDLMDVYNELSVHRKGVTQLMAKVKRCALRAEKAIQLMETPSQSQSKGKDRRGRAKGGATGLTKPYPVTESLCTFVGVPKGTKLARAQVTKHLHNYIDNHGLKDIHNGQYIVPDETLKKLLSCSEHEDEKLTFFGMQKRMNKHFLYSKKIMSNHDADSNVEHTSSIVSGMC